ncbi:MAG: hypothetical protein ACFE0P_07935 [Oceanicaulis sp.]
MTDTMPMRELSIDEIDAVAGGPFPVIAFIAAVVVVDVALIAFTVGAADGHISTHNNADAAG